jgi:SAM-dependent methyltransferase
MDLLADDQLERSAVVANCRMNRERDLSGSNGYDRELGFKPLDFLKERLVHRRSVTWLDLCCRTGRALIQAFRQAHAEGLSSRIEIVGVDLVGMFDRPEPGTTCVRLIEASLTAWKVELTFDLITCVHGLHYIGDKLRLIARAATWLVEDGVFVANLDLHNLKFADGNPAGRRVAADLRRSGLEYERLEATGLLPGSQGGRPAVPLPRGRRPGRAELHGAARRGFVLRTSFGEPNPGPLIRNRPAICMKL